MYIEYVTASVNKVLHQLREVGTMASATNRPSAANAAASPITRVNSAPSAM